jgi:WD repeat-containing protein 61
MHAVRKKVENAHEDGVWSVDWRKDRIATGSMAGRARVKTFRAGTLDAEHTLDGGHALGVVSVSLSPRTPTTVASASLDGLLRVWDVSGSAPAVVRDIECEPGAAWGARFSPDGTLLAVTGQGGAVSLFSAETGERAKTLQATAKFASCVAWSADGRLVACGGTDGSASVFEVQSGKRVHGIAAHAMPVRSVAFFGTALLTASDDRHVNAHDVERAALVSSYSGHASWVLAVAGMPGAGSRVFATGSADKSVKLWDTATKSHVHTFAEHSDLVWSVAWNDDGSELASVSDDRSLVVYSIKK